MSAAWALLAAAVLVAPGTVPAARLAHLTASAGPAPAPGRWRAHPGRLRAAVPLVAVAVLSSAGPGPALAAGLAAAIPVELWRYRVRTGDARGDEQAWMDALDSVVADLRSGRPPLRAWESAAGRAPAAVAGVIGPALAVESLGGAAAEALLGSGDDVAVEVGAAWRLGERHGISLAEVLDRVREDLADRADRGRHLEASLAGPRATALSLALLPVLGLGMGLALGADPVGVFRSGIAGGALAVVGVALVGGGLWWTEALVAGARR